MKKYICKICGKEFKSHSALGGHSGIHSDKKKLSDEQKKALKLKRITVVKQCEKCGKNFKVIRTVGKDGVQRISKKEKRFCCMSCSNSHIISEETRSKISKRCSGLEPWNKGKNYKVENGSLVEIDVIERFCLNCGKKICKTNKSGYCNICTPKTKERRRKHSKNLKIQYKNGRDVHGGKTKWYNYKNIRVQGTYELRTCRILDKMLKLGEINYWEYTKDRIKYIGEDKKEHSYLLDFKINNSYYIETKGFIQDRDLLKWEAAKNQGFEIVKWFLEDIEKEEKRLNMEYVL